MTNAERLASVGGGGTSVQRAAGRAEHARRDGRPGDRRLRQRVVDRRGGPARHGRRCASGSAFRARNPGARLVLIDLQPYATTQAAEREDILNVGGFSDEVFDVIADFAAGQLNGTEWIDRIDAIAV